MKIQELFENKIIIKEGVEARIQHAEDLIFWEGSRGALRAVTALQSLEQGKHNDVTIKWDGSPAVIFGRNEDGEFIFTDKSGFNAKTYDGKPTSSDAVRSMFAKRNPSKPEQQAIFADSMANLYKLYEQSFPNHVIGYLAGDLLYTNTPPMQDNKYIFKPNLVTYKVDANSSIGQQIKTSITGVVVHKFLTPDGISHSIPPSILNQMQSGSVLYFPPVTVQKPPLVDDGSIKDASARIAQYSSQIDDMLNVERLTRLKMKDLPAIFYTYLNSKVDTGLSNLGNDFFVWLNTSKVSEPKKQRLQQYLNEHQNAFVAMWKIVDSIMHIKNNIIKQFDGNQGAIEASIDDQSGGEGYVLNHPDGAIKLVNRAGFTAANRQIQRESNESIDQIKKLSGMI